MMRSGNGKRIPAGLIFFEGQEKPRQYVIFNRATVRGQCDMEVFTTSSLQLTYPFLDQKQCEIYIDGDQWMFRNLSENVFTFVGGKSLGSGAETPLSDGTVIRLSNDRMLTAIFFTEFVSGRDWKIINMDDGRHTVKIANHQAEGDEAALSFDYEDGHWTLTELVAHDVMLNGKPVESSDRIRIDDIIEIGDTKFVFEGSGLVYGYPTQGSGLSINIDERSAHIALRKVTLLKDINLQIEPGNMVLILGGSGAGKSTFVNAVTGYEKAKATIKEGDLDYYRDYGQVKHRIGFVPQENLMREDDTVGDTVMNAAEMRLPTSLPQEEKEKRVAAVLETFGLSGREKELVSKLSGGQKKRLSICMEFVASPSLFILDEPDSGLDGIMATELMENLRLIACQGRIVMVITHAPDRVAHLFDKVIVLAKGTETKIGQLAFYGGIQEARDFFGVPSMEEVVRLINAKNEGGAGRSDEFINKYKEYSKERDAKQEGRAAFKDLDSAPAGDSIATALADKGSGTASGGPQYRTRLEQIPVYLGKQFRLFYTEMNWKVLPMAAIIAFLVVYVLGNKMFRNMEFTKYGSLALVCVCIWNGMFNSIQVVCKERNIIKREHRAGLHISSYLASHMIYQAIICLLQVVITLVIFKVFGMYFPDKGLITGSFAVDAGICMFLATYAADMMALMVSCIVRTTTTAMTVMPFLLIVQLVFAGSIFPLNRPTAKFLANFTISNWGINAINIAADYNSQKSSVIYTAVDSLGSEPVPGEGDAASDAGKTAESAVSSAAENAVSSVAESAASSVAESAAPGAADTSEKAAAVSEEKEDFLVKLKRVLAIPEIKDRVETYTAQKMQVKDYAYTKSNLLKCWGILALFSAIYALIGLVFLEMVDRDKR